MTTYIVTKKSDGEEVYRYSNDAKIIWDQFPESGHIYTAQPDAPLPPPPSVYNGRRILTKLEFRRLFTASELYAIDEFADKYATLGMGVDFERQIRTKLKSYNEAENISLDDPDIPSGLVLYTSLGFITAARVLEVLNG